MCEATFKYYQEGNTNGTTAETEELDITLESVCGDIRTVGYFYTIRTTSGWSINSEQDLVDLFKDIENRIKESI